MTGRNLQIGAAFVAGGMMSIMAFVTWALVYRAIPTENREILTQLLGVLSANVGLVVGFYYGSTAANRTKDVTIATLASQNKGEGQ